MPTFEVRFRVRETTTRTIEIDATTAEKAVAAVMNYEFDNSDAEEFSCESWEIDGEAWVEEG